MLLFWIQNHTKVNTTDIMKYIKNIISILYSEITECGHIIDIVPAVSNYMIVVANNYSYYINNVIMNLAVEVTKFAGDIKKF